MGTEEQKINPVARNILQFYFPNVIINQYWREIVVMGLILWSAITTERFSLLTLTEIVGAVSIIVFRLAIPLLQEPETTPTCTHYAFCRPHARNNCA